MNKIFAVAVGLGMISSLSGCGALIYSPEEGKEYLESKGYKNVEGGSVSYFSLCNKGETARSYTATDQKGHNVNKTVCFGLLGKHTPLFGMI